MVTSKSKGTQLYLAPETFAKENFAAKPLDVWAAGCTLYNFVTGEQPRISSLQAQPVTHTSLSLNTPRANSKANAPATIYGGTQMDDLKNNDQLTNLQNDNE